MGAFDGILEAAEELLEVFATLDEIDVGGVDDQEIGSGVAEEEVFIGTGDFFHVFGRDVGLFARGLLGDAGAKDFGLCLKIDDQIGRGNIGGQGFVVTVVEFQLFVIEVEIGEDSVFFHQKIGEHRTGSLDGEGFADAFLALEEEVHLRVEAGAGFFLVEIGEEGIVFAIVDAASVKALRKDLGERGFADTERTFDDDEARRLRATLCGASALGGGFVSRHGYSIC